MRPSESFVAQPIRSLQTMLLVLSQDDPRLPVVIPDGIYGPSTMQAVATFQRLYGMPATGVTDQATWDRIVVVYEPAIIRVGKASPIEALLEPGQVISKGERNPYMFLTQAMLAQLSEDYTYIPRPEMSGILDDDTSESLLAFQELAGLPATGLLDRISWMHLVNHFALNAHNNGKQYS